MVKFVKEASIPVVTILDDEPNSLPYMRKFFHRTNAKAILFVNFSTELDAFKSKYNDVAALYRGDGIGFLLGDVDASEEAFRHFGLKPEQAPVVRIVHIPDGHKYRKGHVEPDELAAWFKDYKDGKLKP